MASIEIRGRRCSMRKRGPQKFSEEFRREAVRLARDPRRSVTELSAELGVSTTTLRNWIRTVPLEKPTTAGRVLSLEEQVRRLTRENERLREEREILKKATAFFARERRWGLPFFQPPPPSWPSGGGVGGWGGGKAGVFPGGDAPPSGGGETDQDLPP